MARALRGLPVTAEAFAAGRLSYSEVRAITRVGDPDTEVELVELAAHATASQVERVVRAWRRADEVDAGRVAERRAFAWSWDADGMLALHVRLDAEQGAALLGHARAGRRPGGRVRCRRPRRAAARDRRGGRFDETGGATTVGTVTLPAIEVAPPPGDLPRPALTIVPPGFATSSPWPCRPLRW